MEEAFKSIKENAKVRKSGYLSPEEEKLKNSEPEKTTPIKKVKQLPEGVYSKYLLF